MSTVLIPSSPLAISDSPSSPGHHAEQSAVTQDAVLPQTSDAKNSNGLALGIIATAAVIFMLDWAQDFIICLCLGIVFAYTLNPIVRWLERLKIPRVIGTSAVIMTAVFALVFGTYALRGQMQTIITQAPKAAHKLSSALASMRRGQLDSLKKMQSAATDIEIAANPAAGIALKSDENATHVVVDQPTFKLGDFLWAGSKGVLGFIGQTTTVIFLVFFLLLAGDTFKRKLVRVTGPSLTRKRITVHILDDINNSIQRYMFVLLITNLLVALLTWIVFHWIGLENAGAWAVAAGLLHLIPYFGPGITAVVTGIAAFMQFNSLSTTLLVSGSSLLIAAIVGIIITTWMTGRIARMNTTAVFISLLFWSWLWGVWGMLLSMPIIVIVKVVSQHVKQLQTVSELLGE